MINYDLLNQEKRLDGTALAQEHLGRLKEALEETEEVCHDCNDTDCADEHGKSLPTRRVSDLSIQEFKDLMVDCFERLKQRELDTSKKEYDKITTKRIKLEEVFVKDGKAVPQEY